MRLINRMAAIAITLLIVATTGLDAKQPNILLMMVDDMGFSDLGCYGGEIETPNLDRLAKHGLRFTQFYNTARCWPTRAALLTGYYAQQVRRDSLPGIKRSSRPAWAPLLSSLLKPAGYRSYHIGKWHIDGMPIQQGFDRSYYLRDQGRYFYPQVHWEDDKKLPPVERGTDYYITTALGDYTVKYLKEHQAKHADKPFFAYVGWTAPHFPLHALPQDIAKYKDRYKVGWDVIREQRWKRVKASGIVTTGLSEVERQIGPPYHFPDAIKQLGPGEVNRPVPWDTLTDEQKEFQADKMAIHAAMVDCVDQEIGRILEQIESMGAMDDTLVMFLSDNGASAEIMVRTDGHDPNAPRGSGPSYLCLGPGWSNACNTPFRRHKTWVHEGGAATPLIVHWPAGIKAKDELRHTPGHVVDVVPTILQVAGTKPKRPGPVPPGKSLVAAFKADGSVERESIWWCHEGNRAIRMGDWKLVAAKDESWELFDLSKDRSEMHNLADKHPDRVTAMTKAWQQQANQIVKDSKVRSRN